MALTRAATRTTTDIAVEENVQNQEANTVRKEIPPNEMQVMIDDAVQASHPMGEGQRELQMRTSAMEEGASFSTGDISSEVNTTKQEGARAPTNTQQNRETPAHSHSGYTNGDWYPGTIVSELDGRIPGGRARRRPTELPPATRQFYSIIGSGQPDRREETNATGVGGAGYNE